MERKIMNNITVHIADGAEISRQGLVCLVERFACAKTIHSHSTARNFIQAYKNSPNGVCIISTTLADMGLRELMQELKSVNLNCRVIVISGSADIGNVNQALNYGVKGYVTRQVSADELEQTLITVKKGDQAFSRNISKTIVGHYTKKRNMRHEAVRPAITKREREVLSLIVRGFTSAEIAKRLYISPRTVETHRSNLMQKLEIKNTAELVRFAIEEGNFL